MAVLSVADFPLEENIKKEKKNVELIEAESSMVVTRG